MKTANSLNVRSEFAVSYLYLFTLTRESIVLIMRSRFQKSIQVRP